MFSMHSYIDILPIVSYVLSIAGYVPEIYSLTYTIIYKKKTQPYVGNSIWFIWIGGAICSAIYAYLIGQYVFFINYLITCGLCSTVFILRLIQPTTFISPRVTDNDLNLNSDFYSAV